MPVNGKFKGIRSERIARPNLSLVTSRVQYGTSNSLRSEDGKMTIVLKAMEERSNPPTPKPKEEADSNNGRRGRGTG